MSTPDPNAPAASGRGASEFFRFERTGSDLPYYRDEPVGFGLGGWIVILLSVAVGFAALMLTQPTLHTGFLAFIPPALFAGIPLMTLALVGGGRAPLALFRRMRPVDWLLVVGFFVLNWLVTMIVGVIVLYLFDASANPAGDPVENATSLDQVLFFGWSAVSLFAEELLTILPFLAFLTILDKHMSRKVALCLAALGAAVIFALIHLPTYQWNAPQALVGLVPIRIVLLLPFIITRNIWVSTGTHIMNDWAIFGLGLIGASMAAGG